ncbi:MAG: hypothetical protein HYY84_03200 [Deltaproteobacteria bacterium]|nr:hypothetical protein [Deltaproteobacteria bacterium]
MTQKMRHLVEKTVPALSRLLSCAWNRDRDVAKEVGAAWRLKRENIGGPRDAAKSLVQRPHPTISDERHVNVTAPNTL